MTATPRAATEASMGEAARASMLIEFMAAAVMANICALEAPAATPAVTRAQAVRSIAAIAMDVGTVAALTARLEPKWLRSLSLSFTRVRTGCCHSCRGNNAGGEKCLRQCHDEESTNSILQGFVQAAGTVQGRRAKGPATAQLVNQARRRESPSLRPGRRCRHGADRCHSGDPGNQPPGKATLLHHWAVGAPASAAAPGAEVMTQRPSTTTAL